MTTLTTQTARIEHWIAHDPDPHTAAELRSLLAAAKDGSAEATAELQNRFAGPLAFGTAGLRAEVGAGESRLNRANVIRVTAGLAAYLHQLVGEDFSVVIGCDARHGSADFHRDAAAVIAAAGGRALALPAQLPTPVTAFAMRHLNADAGIMITASHNPPADNGYKVYLGGRSVNKDARRGVQIIAPHDAGIAAAFAAAPPADEVPTAPELVTALDNSVWQEYVQRAVSLARLSSAQERAEVRIVITPMHGVGGQTMLEVLGRAGFSDLHVVEEQFHPDADFPSVAFPNPEEVGALDLAYALAAKISADVIIAADPDADRCSVAIPTGNESWRQLSGDEIGAFLGEVMATHSSVGTMATSIVSSRALEAIATSHGLNFRRTLTGFKWISGVEGLVYGYEEAIGYCTDPEYVRDKDGISAAVRVADAVAWLRGQGRGIQDLLDDLARAHGLYATQPLTFRVDNRALIAQGMEKLHAAPPTEIVGAAVTSVKDLNEGCELIDTLGQPYRIPPTEGIMILSAANDRIIARPSGTEPKLKCYLEVVMPVTGEEIPHQQAAARLEAISKQLREALGV